MVQAVPSALELLKMRNATWVYAPPLAVLPTLLEPTATCHILNIFVGKYFGKGMKLAEEASSNHFFCKGVLSYVP